jgi:predicted nucleic acid-binding protein
MIVVVDASVAVKWYAPELNSDKAEKLLDGSFYLNAPELIVPEFGNIVWRKFRQNEFAAVDGRKIIAAFQRVNVRLHSHSQTASAAFVGAELTGQTVYDWSYLALAVALSCQFVTADEKFYKALEKTGLKQNLLWIGDLP